MADSATDSAQVLLEFTSADDLLQAARRLRDADLHLVEAYTPWPVPEVEDILKLRKSTVPRVVLFSGLAGALTAYLIQWWTNALNYPLHVGARPAHALPAFILITFETTVLFAGLSAFFSILYFSRLPRLWHPLFEIDAFKSASIDGFWIEVHANTEDGSANIRAIGLSSGARRIVTREPV